MKVDFSRKVLTINNEEIPHSRLSGNEADKEGLILKDVCIFALCAMIPEADRSVDGVTAFKRLELARRINKGGEQEIEPEEAALLRERAAKLLTIQISGVAYEMLKG